MTTTPKVYSAITAVMSDISKEGIGKDRKNEAQGYKFRGIDDVYNALAPILAKHQLMILPRVLSRDVTERVTIKEYNGQKKESVLFYVAVEVEFDLISGEDGSKHTIKTYGEAMDSGDKATNKSMSAAYKYAAMQAFCIPTEGDNDADAQTHEVAPAAKPASKSASRETYDRLSRANRALTSEVEFNKFWGQQSVQDAVATLPVDWKKTLKSEKDDKAAELSERAAIAAEDTPFDEKDAA